MREFDNGDAHLGMKPKWRLIDKLMEFLVSSIGGFHLLTTPTGGTRRKTEGAIGRPYLSWANRSRAGEQKEKSGVIATSGTPWITGAPRSLVQQCRLRFTVYILQGTYVKVSMNHEGSD